MNPRDRLEEFTVRAARRKIAKDDTIRAAVMIGTGAGVVDRPDTRVRLFDKVGEAQAFLKAKREELEAGGWVKTSGTMAGGVLKFERPVEDDPMRVLALDRRA